MSSCTVAHSWTRRGSSLASRRERDDVEARWLAAPPEPVDAFVEADGLLARWTELVRDVETGDARPFWVRRYWQTRNRRAGIPLGAPGMTAAAS